MSRGGEAAERPWRRLGQWTDLYGQARECLRYARETGRERAAETDLREILRTEVSDVARKRAALLLWALLAGEEGRDPEREPALREAILDKPGIEHAEVFGGGWFELGYFLILVGDARAAELPMRRAIDSGHPDVADQAQCNLGIALAAQPGRERDAEVLLRQAAEHDTPFGPIARRELASLLSSRWARER